MAWSTEKPRLMNFRDWVPDWARVVLYLLFLCSFQFSNGMYFTAFAQMQGAFSITGNDVAMMGQTVLIGLTMYFPLAFRLKFRFTNQTSLLIASLGQCCCNLVFPNLGGSLPLMLIVCFLGGFFRLYGTFECFSNLLPKITPTYNYAVFLSFVFWIVLGFINVFDIISTHIIHEFGWQYVHITAICLTLTTAVLVIVTMRPFRPQPKAPLYGIKWLGFITWSLFILSLIFVAQYGEQYGWLSSTFIRAGLCMATLCLAYGIWAMYHLRHPFIDRGAFSLRNFWLIMFLFLCLDILLSTQTVPQNIVVSEFLGMDQVHAADMKWLDFIGQSLGAIFCWWALTKRRWSSKLVLFICFGAIVLYALGMTVAVSYGMPSKALYLPLALCGFGHVGVFIVLTVYAQATANFTYYFQILALLGFIRTGVGAPIGDAIYSTALTGLMNLRPNLELAIRELYGYSVIFGVLVLALIAASRFKRQIYSTVPLIQSVYTAAFRKWNILSFSRKKNQ